MRVPSALTLVRSHRPALPSYSQTDLAIGTTYSCVANYEGTNVEISMCPRVTETAGSLSGRLIGLTNTDLFLQVANEQGSFTTPSFVSFTEEERLIGEAAKNQAAMNPKNTVFDIKSVLPLRKANCSITWDMSADNAEGD